MNYLAHFYLATVPVNSGERPASLSDGSPDALVGSLLGDFVKGDDHNGYSPEIQRAILVHRQIDSFTDAHPVVSRSKRRLSNIHRHTKGILVDLFYDHFLAGNWGDYATVPLAEFTRHVYQTLTGYQAILPHRLQRMLPYMIADHWLGSYTEVANIGRALQGLSRRLTRPNNLGQGAGELETHYAALKSDFQAFFPDLRAYVAGLRETTP